MKSEEYNESFTAIAPYYDALMSFINYPSWVSYIETILRLNDIQGKTILDLACGTGVCLELWWQKEYKVIGLDMSRSMLQVCKRRFPQSIQSDICLINGDMRNFALAKKLPIITCLYDSLNYILTEKDLLKCFKSVHDTLEDAGIFIFDMNTEYCLRYEWGNSTFHRHDENMHSIWSNSFDPINSISSLNITLNIREDGNIKTIKESHKERGYSLVTVTDLLSDVGFTFSLYKHLTFKTAHERDLRVMGVARK